MDPLPNSGQATSLRLSLPLLTNWLSDNTLLTSQGVPARQKLFNWARPECAERDPVPSFPPAVSSVDLTFLVQPNYLKITVVL